MQRIRHLTLAISSRLPLFAYVNQRGSSRNISQLLDNDNFWLSRNQTKTPLYKDMASLETLNFDNLVLKTLPIDAEEGNYTRQVHGACFSLVTPTPVKNPKLVSVSLPAMQLLDLSEEEITRPDFVVYFSGNKLLPGSQTAAHCYCGHQFGYFSGQLGDGAAM